MADSLTYKLHSGKPNKLAFFISGYLKLLVPRLWYRLRLGSKLRGIERRADADYIKQRANYYLKLNEPFSLPAEDVARRERSWYHYIGRLDGFKPKTFHSAYFIDQYEVTRWFPRSFRWSFCPGDVYFTPQLPTIVKSRLLSEDNALSVVLKLDKLRHFMFVDDRMPFRQKQDKVIFRGKIRQSRVRRGFLEKFFGHPLFNCGVVGSNEGCPEEWMTGKKTIAEHLDYKFIMALEGNDVASNLKWVMSSNSVAVMTRPTCETWFMEGTLVPGYHYIEVKDDFSDLEEKINFYIAHPEQAEQIVEHAHEYVRQFFDTEREELISLLVMNRYFQLSGQKE